MDMIILVHTFSDLSSVFGAHNNLYQNTVIFRPFGDRLSWKMEIFPRHSDKLILGIQPITPELIQIIFTPS